MLKENLILPFPALAIAHSTYGWMELHAHLPPVLERGLD